MKALGKDPVALTCRLVFVLALSPLVVMGQGPGAGRGDYMVSPQRGLRGETYEITVRDPNCRFHDMDGAILEPPQGSKVTVQDVDNKNQCFLIARLTIEQNASFEVVELRVKKGNEILALAPFVLQFSPS